MASGNQMYKGNCALLPQAPTNNISAIPVAVTAAIPLLAAALLIAEYDNDPTAENAMNIAIIIPQSPTRLVTNAFLPAVAADSRVCQKEMRK
jgi:hypothetical protein